MTGARAHAPTQFTAASVMMLVDEGRVSLNDEITKYIPDYPTKGNKITIHHLLNYWLQAGIHLQKSILNHHVKIATWLN